MSPVVGTGHFVPSRNTHKPVRVIVISSLMHDKNIKGPIPLPWTIALDGYKVSDSEYSTLV